MVSKIRELCKKNKTSIAALERQLGFGNGVIGRWDKSVPNYDRLCAVANALGVSVSDLTNEATDPEAKKDTTLAGDVGMPEGYAQLTPANREIVDRLIADLAKAQSKP